MHDPPRFGILASLPGLFKGDVRCTDLMSGEVQIESLIKSSLPVCSIFRTLPWVEFLHGCPLIIRMASPFFCPALWPGLPLESLTTRLGF